jgi:uncharacterized RDD family membrane protein YckC
VSVQSAIGHTGEMAANDLLATGTDGATLREIVAQRVAAHRGRRASTQALEAEREEALRREREELQRESRRGVTTVRDAVRARYAKSQSYREFLAAEAERALQQAQAEAEVAARKAKAVAEAQMQLLAEMEQWSESEPGPREQAIAEYRAEVRQELAEELAEIALGAEELIAEPPLLTIVEAAAPAVSGELFAEEPAEPKAEIATGGLTVRLYEDLGGANPAMSFAAETRRAARGFEDPAAAAMELQELDQEIEFRRSPEFGEHVIETVPLPANLIEFPRQLIASRKARPRLAEGPLREDVVPEPQLRIFEVEPEQISTEPPVAEEIVADAPVWQSLLLDGAPEVARAPQHEVQRQFAQPVDIAPVQLRLMAAAVDGCCVGAAYLAFATVFAWMVGPAMRLMSTALVLGSSVGALLTMALVYQLLFFTFSEATPGMLYARIALCTFSEENPSRKAMRRRVLAMVLAACPVGLGLLWVWMDDQRLGWHDRISRMYQRAY